MIAMIFLALAAATPSPEAQQLGRKLADTGLLASILPMMKQKEVEEIVGNAKDLSDAEKTALRSTADRVYEEGRARLLTATGNSYAQSLSVEDLKALVAFEGTDAAKRYRAAMPGAIASTMQAVGQMDFKKDVRAAFCEEKGKLCDAK